MIFCVLHNCLDFIPEFSQTHNCLPIGSEEPMSVHSHIPYVWEWERSSLELCKDSLWDCTIAIVNKPNWSWYNRSISFHKMNVMEIQVDHIPDCSGYADEAEVKALKRDIFETYFFYWEFSSLFLYFLYIISRFICRFISIYCSIPLSLFSF